MFNALPAPGRTAPSRLAAMSALLVLTACSGDNQVGRFNTAPSVSITAPPDGAVYDEGQVITFEAIVDDDFDSFDKLTVRWSSDLDGAIDSGEPTLDNGILSFSTANLSPGNHAVSLQVVDSEGSGGSSTVAVTVNDLPDAPEISVVHPVSGEFGVEGEDFEFVVQVADSFDEPEDLEISFSSDIDDVFCTPTADAVGVASCEQELTPDDHYLEFTVVDTEGFKTTETVYFSWKAGTEIDDDGDGFSEDEGDCNDGDGSVYPGATEYYNGRDDDCDDVVDNDTEGYDDDGDGQSEVEGDCDDGDANTYEGATETCDGEDDDCDGVIDEDTTCYDDDGDGYTEIDGDCDDTNYLSYPGATEIEDGEDNDCDGVEDEGTDAYDDDGDGYTEHDGDCDDDDTSISPAATEECGDGADNDCDGSADEAGASGCEYYYYDYDGDGYGSSSVSGKCLCTSSGYYDSPYATDCYDYNTAASPAATSYSTSHRGDSSYDYNCDSSESKYWTSTGGCGSWPGCSATSGWKSSVASCGSSASYVTSCSIDWFSCESSTSTYTQKCI